MPDHDLNYAASEWQKYEAAQESARAADRNHRRQQQRAARLEQRRLEEWQTQLKRAAELRKQGRLKAALRECDSLIRECSDWGDAWFVRGRVHLDLGNLRRAIRDFSTTISRDAAQSGWLARWFGIGFDPSCARPYYFRALAWRNRKNERRCLADLEAAIRIDSRWAEPRVLRAEILLDRKRRLPQVIADLDVAVQADRKNARLWFLRGQARLQSGDRKRADADFAMAGKLDASYQMQTAPPPNAARKFLADIDATAEVTVAGGLDPDADSTLPEAPCELPLKESAGEPATAPRTSTYQPYDAWKFPMRIVQQQQIDCGAPPDSFDRRLDSWAETHGFRKLKSGGDRQAFRRGRIITGPFARPSDHQITVTLTPLGEGRWDCQFEIRSLTYSFNAKENTFLSEEFDKLVTALESPCPDADNPADHADSDATCLGD